MERVRSRRSLSREVRAKLRAALVKLPPAATAVGGRTLKLTPTADGTDLLGVCVCVRARVCVCVCVFVLRASGAWCGSAYAHTPTNDKIALMLSSDAHRTRGNCRGGSNYSQTCSGSPCACASAHFSSTNTHSAQGSSAQVAPTKRGAGGK